MHTKFAEKTSNVKRFLAGTRAVETRGSAEACWLAAIGDPGFGKTKTMQWYAVQQKGVYIRAKDRWTPRAMLSELAGLLVGSETEGSTWSLFQVVLREIAKQRRTILIDEAWHVASNAHLLETLRDLSDMVEHPMILGGEKRVMNRLALRFPQFASRITEVVEFKSATRDDVRELCDALSEAPIADDVVERIHHESNGFLREIKNGIAKAESVGKRNGKKVEAKDVAGIELCRDRASNLPTVR